MGKLRPWNNKKCVGRVCLREQNKLVTEETATDVTRTLRKASYPALCGREHKHVIILLPSNLGEDENVVLTFLLCSSFVFLSLITVGIWIAAVWIRAVSQTGKVPVCVFQFHVSSLRANLHAVGHRV
jgi:hypothetical protein